MARLMSTHTERASHAAGVPSARSALAAGTGTLLLWSGTPIANKIVIDYMDGFTAGLVRSTLAGIVAVAVALALRLPFPRVPRDRALLILSGVASFAAWPVTLSIGLERTSAGHAALILATIPILAVLLAALLDRRAPSGLWWLGTALALGGCALLIGTAGGGAAAASPGAWTPLGDVIVFIGGAICAVGYVAGGRLSPRIGTAATTFWGLSVAMIVLVPLLSATASRTAWGAVAAEGWAAMAWMSLLSSLAAYALWFYALGRGGIRISSLLLVMPAITLVGASWVLGEPIAALMIASCALVVLGTYLAHRYAR